MPLEEKVCSDCGSKKNVCPNCGSQHVTPREDVRMVTPNHVVDYWEGGEYEWTHVCWDCGWEEKVTATIEREVTYGGD